MLPIGAEEAFMSWARYLSWADLRRKQLDEYFAAEGERDQPGHIGRFIMFMCHWYASLHVVVEGWPQLNLEDIIIEGILGSQPNRVNLLKRCRNGVYHFQPKLIEPRFSDILKVGECILPWAHALHGEFIRVFWQFPETLGLLDGQGDEWREVAYDILGWLPDGSSPYVRLTQLERTIREGMAILRDRDDSQSLRDLRAAMSSLQQESRQLRHDLSRRQQEYLKAGRWLDLKIDESKQPN
ncbi:MAG: hypothetical protein HY650_07710 [Acidobacteria bacterium]|nr:hypothetical protein [Acidobacteriota bacterium]